jgi:hypothetical protein
MSKKILELCSEKKSQDTLFLEKVDSKNKKLLQKVIVEYDLSHSFLSIINRFYDDKERICDELKKMVVARELYLMDVCNKLKTL